jgi:hypothetical protein
VRATTHGHMSFESMVAYAQGRYCVDEVANRPPELRADRWRAAVVRKG